MMSINSIFVLTTVSSLLRKSSSKLFVNFKDLLQSKFTHQVMFLILFSFLLLLTLICLDDLLVKSISYHFCATLPLEKRRY